MIFANPECKAGIHKKLYIMVGEPLAMAPS